MDTSWFSLEVARTWDGQWLSANERAEVRLRRPIGRDGIWTLQFRAPFDPCTPAPVGPPGYCDGLWEFEVLELFIAGANGHYLEIQVGPWGHSAAFYFESTRQRARVVELHALRISQSAVSPTEGMFTGELAFGGADLPPGQLSWNAYRISGKPRARRYFAAFPVPGERPDFHQIGYFEPLPG